QLSQKFVGRHKERVLLEDSTNDNQRMRSHDIHNELAAKLGEIVSTYDRVDGSLLTNPYSVCPRFVLEQIIHPRYIELFIFITGSDAFSNSVATLQIADFVLFLALASESRLFTACSLASVN